MAVKPLDNFSLDSPEIPLKMGKALYRDLISVVVNDELIFVTYKEHIESNQYLENIEANNKIVERVKSVEKVINR